MIKFIGIEELAELTKEFFQLTGQIFWVTAVATVIVIAICTHDWTIGKGRKK